MSAGKVEFEPLKLVEDLAHEVAGLAMEKRLDIGSFAMPGLPPTILGFPDIVHCLLKGLCTKAINHTKQGVVLIEALLESRPEGDMIKFGVSDSRDQLTNEQLEDIRGALVTDHESCTDLLSRLGTKLEVENLRGRITRFFWRMPIERAGARRPEILPAKLSGLRVFLVSNDPPQNRFVQNYLRFAGAEFDGAPSASETLLELGRQGLENAFDVIAVAPPIEDMSPFEIARQIRQSEIGETKLLYLASSSWSIDNEKELIAERFDAALSRPLRRQDLWDTLNQLVGGTKYATKEGRPLALIVEDNLINQKIIQFQLRSAGLEVDCASNGREAVNAASKIHYAMIFMDVMMPVMDGIEATQQIRADRNGKNANTPIIAVTANDNLERKARDAGMNDFLVKPASTELIRASVEKHLGTRVV